jgi:hypothetical protein
LHVEAEGEIEKRTTGVVMSTYVPAGDIPLGSLSQAEPSAKKMTRRAKMATDAT